MASRKSFLSRSTYIFPETSEIRFDPKSSGGVLEFDEADIWNVSGDASEGKKVGSGSRSGLKMPSRKVDGVGRGNQGGSASLPLNIPDWSKILKGEYKQHGEMERDDEVDDANDYGGDEDDEMKIPPHEYLARTRGASLSVHEGIGRTLKGRDLRRVRNAIWKKVGFED